MENKNLNENTKKPSMYRRLRAHGTATTLVAVVVILCFLFNLCTFTVLESDGAVVSVMGKMNKIITGMDNKYIDEQNKLKEDTKGVRIVKHKGLFFKIPFITSVKKETEKAIIYVSQPELINTKDKVQYRIVMYAVWKISHMGLYRMSLGTVDKANALLDDLVYPSIIKKVNALDSDEFMANMEKIEFQLKDSMSVLNKKIASNGIQVDEVEIFRTMLPPANISSTYVKMNAEREAIATKIKAEGEESYQKIKSETDTECAKLLSESKITAAKTIASADAEATRIYANSFKKDPAFYERWKAYDAFKNSIDGNTTIFLDENNAFIKYFSGK